MRNVSVPRWFILSEGVKALGGNRTDLVVHRRINGLSQTTVKFKFYSTVGTTSADEIEDIGCEENTAEEAHDSAAAKAIHRLEREFSIKLVDFSSMRSEKIRSEHETISRNLQSLRAVLLDIEAGFRDCLGRFETACVSELMRVLCSIRRAIEGERTVEPCPSQIADELKRVYGKGQADLEEFKGTMDANLVRLTAADLSGVSLAAEHRTENWIREVEVDLKQICSWVVKKSGLHLFDLTTNILFGWYATEPMFQCEAIIYGLCARTGDEIVEVHASGEIMETEFGAGQIACYRALVSLETKFGFRVDDYHEPARRMAESSLDDMESIHEDCVNAASFATGAFKDC